MIAPAQTRVLETIYCRQYYGGGNTTGEIDEKLCKVPQVQREVAMLKGWQLTFDSIGMLAFSVPWAAVADIYGRKPVLVLVTAALFAKYVYVQLLCALGGAVPLSWTWLSSLHTIAGGGVAVTTALVYTIISDVVPVQERVAIFFQVMAANIATQFLGSLLSAALMVWNPWIPMLLGLAVELLSLVVLWVIPETLHYHCAGDMDDNSEGEPTEAASLQYPEHTEATNDGREDLLAQIPTSSPHLPLLSSPHKASWLSWRSLVRYTRNLFSISSVASAASSLSFLLADYRILLLAALFFVHMLFLNRDVMLQYISTRYGVSLAYATVLISVRSGLVSMLCVVLLPLASRYGRNRWGSSNRADLLLARASAAAMALGFLGLALAPPRPPPSPPVLVIAALVLNAFGWGLFSFLRSLATSLVAKPHHVARLNSVIGVFDTVGLMVGSPMLAALFARGLALGGTWKGLPFLFCAGMVALEFVLLVLAPFRV